MRNNVPSGYGFKYSFSFTSGDWKGIKYKATNGGLGKFDDVVKCSDNGQTVDCSVDLKPQQAVGFALEPGYSRYFSYSNNYYSL